MGKTSRKDKNGKTVIEGLIKKDKSHYCNCFHCSRKDTKGIKSKISIREMKECLKINNETYEVRDKNQIHNKS